MSAGVEGEKRNLTPKTAFYIGSGLAKLLSDRFGKPTDQLKVSVSILLHQSSHLLFTNSKKCQKHGCMSISSSFDLDVILRENKSLTKSWLYTDWQGS